MNWKTIIEDLSQVYEQKQIAAHAGLAESAISRMKQGVLKRVSYEAGCKLVELHRKAARKAARKAT